MRAQAVIHSPNSAMSIIFITDIFGLSEATDELSALLSGSVHVIDPYDAKRYSFVSDDEAYQHFIASGGIRHYQTIVKRALESDRENRKIAIGFSAGASALWCNLGSAQKLGIREAICFYGSQIRKDVDVSPTCNTSCIFTSETTFSVFELMTELSKKALVRCWHTNLVHGFMNKRSRGFNQAAFDFYVDWIKNRSA